MDLILLKVVIGAVIGIVIAIITYFIKVKFEKIDNIENKVQELRYQIIGLEERIKQFENTNLPVLLAIKDELGAVNTSLRVLEKQLETLEKKTARQGDKIDDINEKRHD